MSNLYGLNPQDFKKQEAEYSDSTVTKDQQLNGKDSVDEIASSNIQDSLLEPTFISQNRNGKHEIDYFEMQKFLNEKGFYKLELIKGYVIIRIESNICREYELHQLKSYIASQFVSEDKINFLIKGDKTTFDSGKMDYLEVYKGGFNSDTQETAFVYFRNTIVKLEKGSLPRLIPFSELTKPIWNTQIIDRDFELCDWNELSRGEFYQFALNVSNGLEEKLRSLCSTFGYALHGVRNPAKSVAIIYIDEKIPIYPGEKNGGTGKTFSTIALNTFKGNTISIVGSAFSRGNRFAWQECNLTTERVVINETPDDFKFENLFSEITEGIPVEKKHVGIFRLENAKILITTNNMIKGSGSSFRRRNFSFEFADHYSDTHTVEDEFGHLFFVHWDVEQWILFDNLMIYCQQLYLDKGLIEYSRKNVELRKFQEENPQLFEFFEDLESGEYRKKELLFKFNNMFSGYPMSQKKLTSSFKEYCKLGNYFIIERPGAGGANQSFVLRRESAERGVMQLKV
jgi:hypothetical protein